MTAPTVEGMPVLASVTVTPDDYTGQMTTHLAGHRVGFPEHDATLTTWKVGRAADGTWWGAHNCGILGDGIVWSGPADALLLCCLIDDGASIVTDCGCGCDGQGGGGGRWCIRCDGTGVLDTGTVRAELDRRWGK